MGFPQIQDPPVQQSQSDQPKQQPSTTPSVSSLPPEAIQLASTLFDYARTGNAASLQQYVTAGIPPNLTNHKGDTLLMLAAYHGHLPTVQMLLAAGADPDALNERGQSIVAGAVFKGEEEVVRVLAEAGADLNAGRPSARESAVMFRRMALLRLFGMEAEAEEIEASQPG